MDQRSLKKINYLHPIIRGSVFNIYEEINRFALGIGLRCRINSTFRTPEEQKILYSYGRTVFYKDGERTGKVTNAKPFQSFHNYGLALDFCLIEDRNFDGKFESASFDIYRDFDGDGRRDYLEVIQIFKKYNFKSGSDFKKFKDWPHIEKPILSIQDLKNKYDSGDTFQEIISGNVYTYVNL